MPDTTPSAPAAAPADSSPVWTGAEVARLTDGTLLCGPSDWTATSVGYRPKDLRPGQLVLTTHPATWGRKFADTTAGASDFAAQGAAAIITDRVPTALPARTPVLKVADTRTALNTLAAAARARLAGRVVCIVGDTGRDFARGALAGLLAERAKTATNGPRLDGARGVALSLARTPADAEFVVHQVATRSPEFARAAARMLQPHVVVVTDVERAHSKTATDDMAVVLTGLAPAGTVVVNIALPHRDRILLDAVEHGATRAVTYGLAPTADVRLAAQTLGPDVIDATATVGGDTLAFVVPAAEPERVGHMLGVIGALDALGVRLSAPSSIAA